MQKIVQKAKEAEEKEVNKIIEHIEMANKQLEQENLKSLEDSYVGEEIQTTCHLNLCHIW